MRDVGGGMQRRFHPELESLRGLAALSVAGFHISQAPVLTGGGQVLLRDIPSAAMDVLRMLFQGQPAVVFFFVLSGFVLTASLQNASRPLRTIAMPFVVARLFRIYPAWIFTILVFLEVYWLSGRTLGVVPTVSETFRNLLLLSVSMDGVGWSIQTELLAIPVMLLAFHWITAGKIVRIFVIASVLAVFINLVKVILPLPGGAPRAIYLYCFLFGALTHVLLPRADPRRANLIFCLGVALFFLGVTLFARHSNIKDAWVTIASCLMIAGGALGLQGWLTVFRDNASLRFLGRVSYSFYLLHPLTLMIFWQMPQALGVVLQAGCPPWLAMLAMVLVSTAVALPLAALSYYFVEKPFIRLGRQFTAATQSREVAPAGSSA
ncbi:acyltransferase [Bradyrhizobium sp. G127]|uniref:acyltransferase family protein n=1 Tax=Bradyrhizobium sp. G127 TaxID=2904800 RepID=UPI001F3E5C4A|nr:acyltransferase [Bradyrhizobium sp. G127]MCF2522336.1 acyltransferase [Bradyrhizobium sp. G127]